MKNLNQLLFQNTTSLELQEAFKNIHDYLNQVFGFKKWLKLEHQEAFKNIWNFKKYLN